MTNPIKKPPGSGHMKIQMPTNLEPAYANLALITNSPSEIVIDFAQIMPRTPRARLKVRVVMTPTNAKALSRALESHLKRYESQHGEITVPEGPSLADELFRPQSSSQDPSDE